MTNRREFLKIAGLTAAWPCAGAWRKPRAVLVNDLHSQLNPTRVRSRWWNRRRSMPRARRSAAARREQRAVCIAGGRHANGRSGLRYRRSPDRHPQSSTACSASTWSAGYRSQSGMQWPKLLAELTAAQRGREKQWGFRAKQTGATASHGRLSPQTCTGAASPFRLSWATSNRSSLLDAKRASFQLQPRPENPELFRLAIAATAVRVSSTPVTLRLVPRRKVERVVQVCATSRRFLRPSPAASATAFLYGDFPVLDRRELGRLPSPWRVLLLQARTRFDANPTAQKELAERDWTNLLLLAHTDKAAAFKRYAGYYLTTNRQVYWSDEHQMSIYPDYDHREIDAGSRRRRPRRSRDLLRARWRSSASWSTWRGRAPQRDGDHLRHRARDRGRPRKLPRRAKKPYACVIFNLHVWLHTPGGMRRASNAFRRLIDLASNTAAATTRPTQVRDQETSRDLLPAVRRVPEAQAQARSRGSLPERLGYRHYRKMFAS